MKLCLRLRQKSRSRSQSPKCECQASTSRSRYVYFFTAWFVIILCYLSIQLCSFFASLVKCLFIVVDGTILVFPYYAALSFGIWNGEGREITIITIILTYVAARLLQNNFANWCKDDMLIPWFKFNKYRLATNCHY